MPAVCRYCCKSPKLPGGNFPATRRSHQRAPILVASVTLPRSPVSFSSSDEVPHIFTRKSRLQPAEFLIACAKKTFATISASSRHMQCNKKHRYSISSLARRRNASGIVKLRALAVVRLMMRSNLVGCSTGMLPGLAPRRILST